MKKSQFSKGCFCLQRPNLPPNKYPAKAQFKYRRIYLKLKKLKKNFKNLKKKYENPKNSKDEFFTKYDKIKNFAFN